MVGSDTTLARYVPNLVHDTEGNLVVQHKNRLLQRAKHLKWIPKPSKIPGAGTGLFSLQQIKYFGTGRCFSNCTQLIMPLTGCLTGAQDTGENVAAFFCKDEHDLMGLAGSRAHTHPYRLVRVTLSGDCAKVNSIGPPDAVYTQNHFEIDKCGWYRIIADVSEGEEVLTEYRDHLQSRVSVCLAWFLAGRFLVVLYQYQGHGGAREVVGCLVGGGGTLTHTPHNIRFLNKHQSICFLFVVFQASKPEGPPNPTDATNGGGVDGDEAMEMSDE